MEGKKAKEKQKKRGKECGRREKSSNKLFPLCFTFTACFLSLGFMLGLPVHPHVTAKMATSCSELTSASQLTIPSVIMWGGGSEVWAWGSPSLFCWFQEICQGRLWVACLG